MFGIDFGHIPYLYTPELARFELWNWNDRNNIYVQRRLFGFYSAFHLLFAWIVTTGFFGSLESCSFPIGCCFALPCRTTSLAMWFVVGTKYIVALRGYSATFICFYWSTRMVLPFFNPISIYIWVMWTANLHHVILPFARKTNTKNTQCSELSHPWLSEVAGHNAIQQFATAKNQRRLYLYFRDELVPKHNKWCFKLKYVIHNNAIIV